MKTSLHSLLDRADGLLQRLEAFLPPARRDIAWDAAAFRWLGTGAGLVPISRPRALELADIQCLDRQKAALSANTRQLIQKLPANNALLWGSRGTGKSSLVKALLTEYGGAGLRLIEVDRTSLAELPALLELIEDRPERFILYCDDLSFEAGEGSYKPLKATLEGSLAGLPDNVLIYATSNRRHLLPEYHRENLEVRHDPGENLEGEIHHGDSVEEKISLSERFGLWLSFHPFSQDQYLHIVRHWLGRFGDQPNDWEAVREAALRFALERGSRSGRVAAQFARAWYGSGRLERMAADTSGEP
jgi:predicted AAA+ superfamily ATPase